MSRRDPELLGIHGLVLKSADPAALARRWTQLTGLPVLRRSSREIVLGRGPELFVTIRRAPAGTSDAVEETHVAVKRLADTGRRGEADALGGDSWSAQAGALRVVLREFRRPPGGRWRKKRKR